MSEILEQLTQVLEKRKSAPADQSYVSSLHQKGLNKILEKVGEEAVETILASKDYQLNNSAENRNELIKEIADLWFHSMVMLSHQGLKSEDVLAELEKRFDLSGLIEKQNRTKS